jgi:hypothetical protein
MSSLLQRACHAQRLAIVLLMFALDVPVRAQTAPRCNPANRLCIFPKDQWSCETQHPGSFPTSR